MLGFLRKYVFANAGLKLLAIAISFLLWATYTAEPYAEVGFQVPLEFTTMPSQLEMSGDVPTVVHVRVRGRSALLRRMIPGGMRSSAEHSGIEGLILPDLAGICWLLWPQLFTTKLRVMDIEIAGELTQGMCVIDARPTRKTPNVELVVDADMVSIKAELHKAFHGFGG